MSFEALIMEFVCITIFFGVIWYERKIKRDRHYQPVSLGKRLY